MDKIYIKSQTSKPAATPDSLAGGGRNTQKVLLTIVLLIGLTSTMIGMAVACTFPDLFLKNSSSAGDELTGVPDVRQSNGDGSAAAAFQGVMAFYGIDRGEQEWREAIGPSTDIKEKATAMASAAREQGFEADVMEGIGTDELTALIAEGVPVIVPLDGKQYVIVVGKDTEAFILEDPATFGGRTHLKRDEFAARWIGGTAVAIRSMTRD
ncbi:hypothetical protein RJ40_07810 [Methanofollis aquaemaris]|uniref:Peptidase C39 domain-containing protein n=1 Tax=Methanofollis aquaemaris TaxID=126734 RepID=A0A8A3S5K3_9EURY|nr:cysteine peptidase family C39 domain-containing protein [Methanofollis aquaemaris]QSZ67415.1 hypothetical protein RJ40_07810 [Methanofollis aquaemaris]